MLFEYVMENDFEALCSKMKRPLSADERQIEVNELLKRNCYGNEAAVTAMKKYLTPEETAARRAFIGEKWSKLQQMLKNANCPSTPAEIGLDIEQTLHAIHTAQTIRIRYTILDLLYECGLLDDACKKIEEKLF